VRASLRIRFNQLAVSYAKRWFNRWTMDRRYWTDVMEKARGIARCDHIVHTYHR